MVVMIRSGPFFIPRGARCLALVSLLSIAGWAQAQSAQATQSAQTTLASTLDQASGEDTLEAAQARAENKGTIRIDTEESLDGSTEARLIVESDVPDTEVFLNGASEGTAPVDLSGIKPGVWRLALRKRGYYTESFLVHVKPGQTRTIRAEMRRITGFLKVEGAVPGTAIAVADETRREGIIELPEGIHEVTIRAFGYRERKETVRIRRERETVISGTLEPAPLDAEGFAPTKRAFNPDNPGVFTFVFQATAPGTGRIVIRNEAREEVAVLTAAPFTTWRQAYRWNGTDRRGAILPDGAYHATLELRPLSSEIPIKELQTSVLIDSSLRYPWAHAFRGTGGIGPVILADVTPPRGALFLATLSWIEDDLRAGTAALYGITRNLEIGGTLDLRVSGTESNGSPESADSGNPAGSIHLKYLLASDPVGLSLAAGYRSNSGLVFASALEKRLNSLSIGCSAEITAGDEEGSLSDPSLGAGFGAFLRLQRGALSYGLFAAGGVDGAGTVGDGSAGAALHCAIPGTNLVVTGEAGYRGTTSGGTIEARAGFGFQL